MNQFVLCGIFLFLGACAHQEMDSNTKVELDIQDASLYEALDGTLLPLRMWYPESPIIGVVLDVHGFNNYSTEFSKAPNSRGLGPVLSENGFAVYSYDQRGFGATSSHSFWPGSEALISDFRELVTYLEGKYPGLPIHAVGFSMGGAVVIEAVTMSDPLPIDSIILVAPAVWGQETMPLFYRGALWLAHKFIPWFKPSSQRVRGYASDNIAMLRANGMDPLIIKDTRIDSIHGLTLLMNMAAQNIKFVKIPSLYVYGAKDTLVPKNATLHALSSTQPFSSERQFGYYEDGWHMLLHDLNSDVVIGDMVSFFMNRFVSLPSGSGLMAIERLSADNNSN